MLKNYIKTAFKVFMRRKVFTLISLFGISITLAVLIVATAFIDQALAPGPPEVNLDRSLMVTGYTLETKNASLTGTPSYIFLNQCVRDLPGAEKVSIYWGGHYNSYDMYWKGDKVRLYFKRTDAAYWQILAFDFLEGRPITEEDESKANFVAVINASTRKKLFGKASAQGKMIEIDNQRFRVVGVVADVPYDRSVPFSDVWVPLTTMKSDRYLTERISGFQALILARKTSDIPKIKEAFKMRLQHVDLPLNDGKPWEHVYSAAETYFELVSRETLERFFGMGRHTVLSGLMTVSYYQDWSGTMMGGLLGAMVLFMVLPTLNLINLNMSRILERASEIGVRKAFGASSWRLVVQFVVENVLLALIGGAIGFVLSFVVLEMVVKSGAIPYAQFDLNLRVFFYGLLISMFFGVFSGTYPAWKMSRLHPVEALRRRTT